MALVAAYRFDEEGSVTRESAVAGAPSLEVAVGTIPDDAGILGRAACQLDDDASTNRLIATLDETPLAGLRSHSLSVWSWWNGEFTSFGNSSAQLSLKTGVSETTRIALGGFIVKPAPMNYQAIVIQQGGMEIAEVLGLDIMKEQWNHIVYTWNNNIGELNLYVNGSLIGSATNALAAITQDLTELLIDMSAVPPVKVDMLCIYDHVIDLATVQQLYNSGAGFDPSDLPPEESGSLRTPFYLSHRRRGISFL